MSFGLFDKPRDEIGGYSPIPIVWLEPALLRAGFRGLLQMHGFVGELARPNPAALQVPGTIIFFALPPAKRDFGVSPAPALHGSVVLPVSAIAVRNFFVTSRGLFTNTVPAPHRFRGVRSAPLNAVSEAR